MGHLGKYNLGGSVGLPGSHLATGDFRLDDIQDDQYWSSTTGDTLNGPSAWTINFAGLSNQATVRGEFHFAWAVRDVAAAAPEPGTLLVFALGMLGLAASRRAGRQMAA